MRRYVFRFPHTSCFWKKNCYSSNVCVPHGMTGALLRSVGKEPQGASTLGVFSPGGENRLVINLHLPDLFLCTPPVAKRHLVPLHMVVGWGPSALSILVVRECRCGCRQLLARLYLRTGKGCLETHSCQPCTFDPALLASSSLPLSMVLRS